MPPDRTHRVWLRALETHVRATHRHELAAVLFARKGDPLRAAIESQRAAAERIAYADAAARHPEWLPDVAVGMTAEQRRPGYGDR
jgi:hypothetical protein